MSGYSACDDEYDSYARPISRFLAEGADEVKIASYLRQFVVNNMGLPDSNDEHNRRIARRLRSLIE